MWGLNIQIGSGGGIIQIEVPNLLSPVVYDMVNGPSLGFLGVGKTVSLEFFIVTPSTKSVMQQIIHNYHCKKYKGKFGDVIHETLKEESEFKNKISEIVNESSDKIVKKSRLSSDIATHVRKKLGTRYKTLHDIADTEKQISE